MKLNVKTINKAIVGLYRKNEISAKELQQFENAFKNYINSINNVSDKETEEHYKNHLRDFLITTFYKRNYINTKSFSGLYGADTVIHSSIDPKSNVDVIIETKNPHNKVGMITKENINRKAMFEAVLYYLEERIGNENIEVKRIIITNYYEFFIFDAKDFHHHFYNNTNIRNIFSKWSEHKTDDDSTKQMYDIISKEIGKIDKTIETVNFNITEFSKFDNKANKLKIKQLYQIFSPRFLLKETPKQDSNVLNKEFYNELLHIIGLEEYKEKNKKLIRPKQKPDAGSLLENTITQIKTHIIKDPEKYGSNKEEQLFNFALQLSITWINRILFLKLLEAQLISYHNGNDDYAFLSYKRINSYNDLTELFFKVLAESEDERPDYIKTKYPNLPYLNSSLFDRTEQEEIVSMTELSNLEMPVYTRTVLKERRSRLTGSLNTLEYIFRFLDAYYFGSKINPKEESKTLINASVLGLIYEKINGYKEGSYYTPGYITMYMCRETIRRCVIDKLNNTFDRNFLDFDELKNYFVNFFKPSELEKANDVINSITICDPAVGSGHFLVSALNELIAIKSELGILCDINGKPLKSWNIEVVNDESFVHDPYGEPFEYKLNEDGKPHRELQNIQETLFHEKQTIIENCLFGVDINPNSVNICRLRLWIELLKNSYYTKESNYTMLHTLPNIDINIKCGNSLISRFEMDTNLTKILPLAHITVDDYLEKVNKYKNATSKNEKQNLRETIKSIKNTFKHELEHTTLVYEKYKKARNVYNRLFNNFDVPVLLDEKMKKQNETKLKDAEKKFNKAQAEWEAWKDAEIYRNAFEWRFEFPEVLYNNGKFNGFDVVIGNPPWGINFDHIRNQYLKTINRNIIVRMTDSFMYFINNDLKLLNKSNGIISQIIPDVFLYQIDNMRLREKLLSELKPALLINLGDGVFQDVARASIIVIFNKNVKETIVGKIEDDSLSDIKYNIINYELFNKLPYKIMPTNNLNDYKILTKYKKKISEIIDEDSIQRGVSPDLKKAFIVDEKIIKKYNIETNIVKLTCTGGEDIKPFYFSDNNKKLLYICKNNDPNNITNTVSFIKQFKNEITCNEVRQGKHPFYSLHRPRNERIFQKKEKIVGVITSDKIICALDTKYRYPTDGCYLFSCRSDYSNKFIVSLFNSKLFTFFYRLLTFEKGRTLAQVKPLILLELPLFNIPCDQLYIISLYNKLIDLLEGSNNETEIELIKNHIDIFVYKLYELTYDEVLIVDPKFEKQMSQEEYRNFNIK